MADTPRIEELRRRVQKDPASIAFAQLAEEHRRIGQFREAVQIARAGLAQHPSYLSARVTLGRALMEVGQHDEAQGELEQVLALAPDNLAAIRALAEIHQRRGELGEVTQQFTTALDVARSKLVFPRSPELEMPALPSFAEDFELKLQPAVDECTRSLEALDAITLDLPPVGEAPAIDNPDEPALRELERWLDAIRADRARRV